jgi:DNA repair protein RecN (Recombination protein N)
MLTNLRIKNFALAVDLSVEFRPGYNVITGETGAGKSLLIGALSLVLGERADRNLIRAGADSCAVEAVFNIGAQRKLLNSLLENNGIDECEEDQLLLKRVLSASGANRQFINGSPATLSALATVGESLVDIHGPHDHQSLLHPSRQLLIVDAFAGSSEEQAAFAALVRRRTEILSQKAALIIDEQTYARQLDLLSFQAREIEAARLSADEESQVTQEYQRSSNASRLLALCQGAQELMAEQENSLSSLAGLLGRSLQELARIDPVAKSLVDAHGRLASALTDLRDDLSRYSEKIEVDPDRLRTLEERLNLIQSLKRKYGGTVSEVVAFGVEARRKLNALEQRDAEVSRLNTELAECESALWRAGLELSSKRRKSLPQLCKKVEIHLGDLGFNQSRFDVSIRTLAPGDKLDTETISPSGLDTLEFLFAPNPGEPARALRAIASSGELARVMLALKTVLAAEDEIPVLVFDEVDANVGGDTAKAVGQKMRQISQKRQVLCVTHLPQVAASASAHLVAVKRVSEGRTISEIKPLGATERIGELARMLGDQSDLARKHAEALIRQASDNTLKPTTKARGQGSRDA